MATLSENVQEAIRCLNSYRGILDATIKDLYVPYGVHGVGALRWENQYVDGNVYNDLENLTLPEYQKPGTAHIVYGAFREAKLTSVTIPKGWDVGDGAFESNAKLEEVYIYGRLDDSVEGVIREGAFADCARGTTNQRLEKVVIGEDHYQIPSACFAGTNINKLYILKKEIRIHDEAFTDSVQDVYYVGSQSDWNDFVQVSLADNEGLQNATFHYNYTPT